LCFDTLQTEIEFGVAYFAGLCATIRIRLRWALQGAIIGINSRNIIEIAGLITFTIGGIHQNISIRTIQSIPNSKNM